MNKNYKITLRRKQANHDQELTTIITKDTSWKQANAHLDYPLLRKTQKFILTVEQIEKPIYN